jgi:hypothetical protein
VISWQTRIFKNWLGGGEKFENSGSHHSKRYDLCYCTAWINAQHIYGNQCRMQLGAMIIDEFLAFK